jgi:calcium-translocating P-type ATPase
VAAVPEALPAVVAISLALGAAKMVKQNALIRRLPAVETLGSITFICSDKTGTLTQNRMHAEVFWTDGEDLHREPWLSLLRALVLVNDAAPDAAGRLGGDPTEVALLEAARLRGVDFEALRRQSPRHAEFPFDSERKRMATVHARDEGWLACVKGAPEAVLERCAWRLTAQGPGPFAAEEALGQAERLAARGLRVLAFAERRLDRLPASIEEAERDLTFLGLVGLMDPPREEAADAVAECLAAGIKPVMITGDHPATARAIAERLGILDQGGRVVTGVGLAALSDEAFAAQVKDVRVYARVDPEQKIRIVQALQAAGEFAAMTGDGVNDAPALKAADIGVAMGRKGTDAAREAADIVLTDDNFASIANAVAEGRTIFDNIKKALLFVLPTNGGEAGVILLAVFLGIALPVTAAQILWINMVTTVTLAIALAFELPEAGVMRRPPRAPTEPLITRLLLARLAYVTALMVAATFFVFEWELARSGSLETARTAAVNMLVFGELIYLFNCRHFVASALNWTGLTGNRIALWVSLALIVLQLAFTYEPTMQKLFHTTALDAGAWALILGLSLGKFLAVEVEKAVLRRFGVVRL